MTSLKFGTSGLRGLVADLDGPAASAYTRAFVTVLAADGSLGADRPEVLVGRDLRASSPSIAARVAAAVAHAGFRPVDCGVVPTPALALAGATAGLPSIMVTGSHIPDDRNGLKFYRGNGEITKNDEAAISTAHGRLDLTDDAPPAASDVATSDVLTAYRQRYESFFPPGSLAGLKVGVYQHSSVARDLLVDMLAHRGAAVVALGRSDAFIPVDTEAVRDEDRALARDWAQAHQLDAIVSTDGDADRPLIADGDGSFLRGDLVGVLTGRLLGVEAIVTPITSNGRIEARGGFAHVLRTRVGSPYVIAGMEAAATSGATVLGFEANGGCLLASTITHDDRTLPALPTRDAVLPILALLTAMRLRNRTLAALATEIGFSDAESARIEHVLPVKSGPFLERLATDRDFAASFFAAQGGVAACDLTDGVRVSTGTGDVVHFRASGNAPEFRIYTEGRSATRARALVAWAEAACMAAMG